MCERQRLWQRDGGGKRGHDVGVGAWVCVCVGRGVGRWRWWGVCVCVGVWVSTSPCSVFFERGEHSPIGGALFATQCPPSLCFFRLRLLFVCLRGDTHTHSLASSVSVSAAVVASFCHSREMGAHARAGGFLAWVRMGAHGSGSGLCGLRWPWCAALPAPWCRPTPARSPTRPPLRPPLQWGGGRRGLSLWG